MKRLNFLLYFFLIGFLLSCGLAPENNTDMPNWLDRRIVELEESNEAPYMIDAIWQYDYESKPVYLFIEAGCDTYQILYNRWGIEIGRSGGYAGIQTGVYLDFYQNKSNGSLIWEMDRE